jgi:hypothetical protein
VGEEARVGRNMMQIKNQTQRMKKKWGKEGFWSWAWRNFLVEVWPLLYDRKRVFWLEKDLVGSAVTPIQPKIPVQIKVVRDLSDPLLPSLRKAVEAGWGHSTFVNDTLRHGGDCYLALDDDRIVSYQWVTSGAFGGSELYLGELDCKPVLPQNTFFFFKAFTLPQYRGNRIIGALKVAAMRDYAAKHYRFASTAVRCDNRPNLKSLSRMGFTACRVISRYRVFGTFSFYLQKRLSICRLNLRLKASSM